MGCLIGGISLLAREVIAYSLIFPDTRLPWDEVDGGSWGGLEEGEAVEEDQERIARCPPVGKEDMDGAVRNC